MRDTMTVIRRKKPDADPTIHELFATCAKGVEEVLLKEIERLGIQGVRLEKGGVRFSGTVAEIYRANLWLRTASRILVPLASFPCDSPEALYEGVRAISWEKHLTPDLTLAVDSTLRDSKLTHSGFVALKTKDAIVDDIRDRTGRRPNVDPKDPDVRINVHLVKNHCTVSLDASGAPLDRRGYRLDRTEAPLRETLAAAVVELTGWDGTVPLVDPMCGSGTIVIEAAMKAANIAPGLSREEFGFQRWPGFDRPLWNRLVTEARRQVRDTLPALIRGSDLSFKAVEIARKNAERAGISHLVSFNKYDVRNLPLPDPPGVLICNPPYGERLDEEEALKPFYKELGDVLKQHCRGYTAWLLVGSKELAKHVGLKASRRIPLFNGPIECRLLKYELY